MDKSETIKVLNELVLTAEDGEKGFAEAADIAEDTKLKMLFKECAEECLSAATELQAKVAELGGKPQDRGSAAGAAHRGWVKVKSSVSDSNIAVLEEVERGEDHAKAAYQKAMKADLPPDIRALVERQMEGTRRNHDRVRDLRNRYKAQV